MIIEWDSLSQMIHSNFVMNILNCFVTSMGDSKTYLSSERRYVIFRSPEVLVTELWDLLYLSDLLLRTNFAVFFGAV